MTSIFEKAFDAISGDDVASLCTEGVPESDILELKRSFPAKGGVDPWVTAREFQERGRNEILSEVVAFANAHGGTLVLGIDESTDHPKRAQRIVPLPACAELADRFRSASLSCIEPAIPGLAIRGVETADGAGVVIFRVPRSRMGPHRLSDKECYVRRGDRSQKMTMREVQDLTLYLYHGAQRIEAELGDIRTKFVGRVKDGSAAVRLSLLPLLPFSIAIEDVISNVPASTGHLELVVNECGERKRVACQLDHWSDWRPVLRGSVAYLSYSGQRGAVRVKASESGTLELDYSYPAFLEADVFFTSLFQALRIVQVMREKGGMPEADFVMELELFDRATSHYLKPCSSWDPKRPLPSFPRDTAPMSVVFPRYVVGTYSSFVSLINLVHRDLWNACSLKPPHDCVLEICGQSEFGGQYTY